MTDATPIPQPGAEKNPMLPLSMLWKDVDVPGWPILDKGQAQNFIANAEAVILKKGETVYRVYGGGAHNNGRYWSPAPPTPETTQADWRRTNAVELSWNSGEKVAAYTAQEDVPIWKGGVEAQHAQDMDEQVMADYWLVGGGTQIFFPNGLPKGTAPEDHGKTPWAATQPRKVVQSLIATPEDFDPADEFAAQAFRVSALADAVLAGPVDDAEATAVANLIRSANTILANIGSDPKMVGAAVRSQVGLMRYVGQSAGMAANDTVEQRLKDVVHGAAVLAGRA